MQVISPITITDEMVGSGAGTVPEVEHPEWSGGSTYNALQKVIVKGTTNIFTDLVAGTKGWYGMAAAPNGDIYACVYGGSIWIQTGGVGPFVDLGTDAGTKNWLGMCASPSGDIYACVHDGSIWKRTAGAGAFTDLSAGSKAWYGITAAPNGDIYACVYGGSIWISTDAGASFSDLGADAGTKDWGGMAAAPNGDVYACVLPGSIWKRTGGTGAFTDLVAGTKDWQGMTVAPNGDVYACVYGGSIWKQTGGTGSFVDLATGVKAWTGMTVAPEGTARGIYACVTSGSIWVTNFEVLHKIYQSLVGSNIGYYPPIDVKQTTPKWVEVSATNKWKVFDGKLNNQMQVVSPAVYTITPGESFNSVAVLNCDNTSVRIQVDDPAYDQTVNTGISDIVKTDLAGDADSVLTITITNTGGLAKCGEIVPGNVTTLGTLSRTSDPVWSFDDYSTKERDVFGDWNIIPRSDSEKLSFVLSVAYGSQDTVAAFVRANKLTPLVFIGHSDFAILIVYGILKSVSIPVKYRGRALIPMEIDGLV